MAVISHLTNRVVLVETDNITTKAHINHMGERSCYLSTITRSLWHVAHRYSIHLVAMHHPRFIDQRAGKLSRWKFD